MSITFTSLGLSAPILEAISAEGYDVPTPIQAKAIPHVLSGRDILGSAQTGTGKTAAFALPTLHLLHAKAPDKSRRGAMLPRALVLSPTRELATQIADSFAIYGRRTGLRGTAVFGGVSQHRQVRSLRAGVDILVATPGRLMDLMEQGHINLSAIEIFILDEADRMLDMGFIQPIRRISAELPSERQTLLFSATMPQSIARLAESLLSDPVKVAVSAVASAAPKIAQSVYMIEQQGKCALLAHLLADAAVERALVFTRTKHGAERLMTTLARSGVAAQAIHGDKSQSQRQRALECFRDGSARVLVATDVAARGLDVDGVTHVFNYNLPNEPEAYIHRVGRTGRAGALGIAISFCDREERGFLKSIEKLTGARLALATHPAVLQTSASDARNQTPAASPTGVVHAPGTPFRAAQAVAPRAPAHAPGVEPLHESGHHRRPRGPVAPRPADGPRPTGAPRGPASPRKESRSGGPERPGSGKGPKGGAGAGASFGANGRTRGSARRYS